MQNLVIPRYYFTEGGKEIAQPLFCLVNLLFSNIPVAVVLVVFVNFLMSLFCLMPFRVLTAILHCVVTENIHIPTMEGIGNSKGEGGRGSKSQEIPEGRGVV